MATSLLLTTSDGQTLEAERCVPPTGTPTRLAAVLCHPHPLFGGSMRAVVVSPLFRDLPALGVDCLRFNFRGVEASSGSFDNAEGEQHDVAAAVSTLRAAVDAEVPLVVIGFSFGADLTLATDHPAINGWCAIAPPLRFVSEADIEARRIDARPKSIILAALDDVRDPAAVAKRFDGAVNSSVVTIGGASHFFVGRDRQLLDAVSTFVDGFASTG